MYHLLERSALTAQMEALKALTGQDVWLVDAANEVILSTCPGVTPLREAEHLSAPLPGVGAQILLKGNANGLSPRMAAAQALLPAIAGYMVAERMIFLRDDLFGRLDAYVTAHLADDLSPKALSAALYASAGTLNKATRSAVDLPLSHFVQQRRLDASTPLLVHTTLSITEIASRVGISDFNYYARLFKKRYGMSPRTYRSTHAVRPIVSQGFSRNRARI